jgi:CheY-like chemotaxis protein
MEYGIVIVIAVIVVLVKGLTGYEIIKAQAAVREQEAERTQVEMKLKQVEEAKLHLEREYGRLDHDRSKQELERNRLESEIRVLGGTPVPESEVIAMMEGTGKTVGEAGETEADVEAVGGDATVGPPDGEKGRFGILVAEDNTELRDVLRTALSRDYRVEGAADGAEALEILKRDPSRFDLLITDLRMPNLDGLGLIQNLTGGMPFIIISAFLHTGEFRTGLADLKPAAVLRKPFKLVELRRAIEQAAIEADQEQIVGTGPGGEIAEDGAGPGEL